MQAKFNSTRENQIWHCKITYLEWVWYIFQGLTTTNKFCWKTVLFSHDLVENKISITHLQ